jgi:lysophospholipase L1-like esterase
MKTNHTSWIIKQSLPTLLFFLACAAGLQAGERVANGSFEATLINGLPEEWELYCPALPAGSQEQWGQGGLAQFATDTTTFHEGRKSLRISSSAPVRCSVLQRNIPARPGDKWRLSFWMKGRSLNMKPQPGALVRVGFLNSSDRDKTARLASLSRNVHGEKPDFDWRKFELNGEVPADANVLQLDLFLHKSKGAVWFDDISLSVDSPSGAPDTPPDRIGRQRYQRANAALAGQPPGAPRVVFMGDSIVDGWKLEKSFPGEGFVNRGIGGQHTWQMVARFPADALALKPGVVVFLGASNDIAGGVPFDIILANIQSMIRACRENNIRMVVSPVLPVSDYAPNLPRTPKRPPERILEFNKALQTICRVEGARYLDLHSPLIDQAGLMRAELSKDGLHPNEDGYKIMAPIVLEAIREELAALGAPR